MRHIGRTHGVSVAWLWERFQEDDYDLTYCESADQCADVYTKASSDKFKWQHACELAGVMDPKELTRVIREHTERWNRQAGTTESGASGRDQKGKDSSTPKEDAAPCSPRGVVGGSAFEIFDDHWDTHHEPQCIVTSRYLTDASHFDGCSRAWYRRITWDWDSGDLIADECKTKAEDRKLPEGIKNIYTELHYDPDVYYEQYAARSTYDAAPSTTATTTSDTATQVQPGWTAQIPEDTQWQMLGLINQIQWPVQKRAVTHGQGRCLGATYEAGTARVSTTNA